jgi:DNA-binding NtrC family response regulator
MLLYAWPGNVRELRNVIKTMCLLRAGASARVRDLPETMRRAGEPAERASHSIVVKLYEALDRIVERVIEAAVEVEGGNRSRAEDRLGISVRTIQRHLGRGGS